MAALIAATAHRGSSATAAKDRVARDKIRQGGRPNELTRAISPAAYHLYFEQEKRLQRQTLQAKEKREREDVPSLIRENWMIGVTSTGNDRRDDYDFRLLAVLRKFDFNAALGELTSD